MTSFLERFVKEVGAELPLEIAVRNADGSGASRWVLHQPFALVGSAREADVRLEHRDVSARHAYLQVLDGGVAVVDLGSRSGTHWGGRPRRSGWLVAGEPFRVGPCVLTLVGGAVRASGEPPLPDPGARQEGADAFPKLELEIRSLNDRVITWGMNCRIALVGRTQPSNISLKHESVSRVHCALARTRDGVWAVDLQGRGGVYLNDERVRFGLLGPDDVLRVGNFTLRQISPMPNAQTALVPSPGLLNGLQGEVKSLLLGQPAGGGEALILPLVEHFSRMQQQMMDQFEQMLMLVLKNFGSWQGDQLTFLRDELAGLREVTREIQELHARMGGPGAAVADARGKSGAGEAPKVPPVDPSKRLPLPPSGPRPNAQPQKQSAESFAPLLASSDAAAAAPAEPSADDAHDWLSRRVADLQQERQSRLQRLLGLAGGK